MRAARHTLEALIGMIDEPNGSICREVLVQHDWLFRQAPGSSYNHQAWTGGYRDHITEVMNVGYLLYHAFASTGRLRQLKPEEQFTLSDVLLVLFWHDIEKPWRFKLQDGQPIADQHGRFESHPDLHDKQQRKQFAEGRLHAYGVVLTPQQQNALDYVEGIRDADYSPHDRRMGPLAALCHMCDLASARLFYDFPLFYDSPLAARDAWDGARRSAGS